jgi:hypothetical protein
MILRLALALVSTLLMGVLMPSHAQAQNVVLVSALGGKCMDSEGGTRKGARVIGYSCNSAANQLFWFNQNGSITQGNLCLDAAGGLGRDGDGIVLWDCNGQANQRWQLSADGMIRGINGKCLDLKGGDAHSFWSGNQPLILFGCHGANNQRWHRGFLVARSNVNPALAASATPAGTLANIRALTITPLQRDRLIAAGGQNLIAAGGQNLNAAGAPNLIAAGGLNLIAAGGQNLIVLVK